LGGYYSPNPNETITAANWKTYVRDQTVNQFASAAARTSAITSPAAGMVSYRTDANTLEQYNGTAWVPAGMQLIASNTLGVAAASVTFSSIPATFSGLMLTGCAQASGAAFNVDCTIRINSDSGANYAMTTWDASQAAQNPAGSFTNANTSLIWGLGIPGTSFNANRAGGFSVLWPNYSNTTLNKVSLHDTWLGDGGTSYTVHKRWGFWAGTSAMNALLITCGSGNFTAGSSFNLYGMP
jgi:hypothetical protein